MSLKTAGSNDSLITVSFVSITLGQRLLQSRITVTAAHARPAVTEMLVLGTYGCGHKGLFPDGPTTAGPGALRPDGRPAALVVFGGSDGGRTTDVSVRGRRGRGGSRGTRQQVFGAVRREAERAYGRRPAFVHGLEERAIILRGHHVSSRPLRLSSCSSSCALNDQKKKNENKINHFERIEFENIN